MTSAANASDRDHQRMPAFTYSHRVDMPIIQLSRLVIPKTKSRWWSGFFADIEC
jgi:hypothetical protein